MDLHILWSVEELGKPKQKKKSAFLTGQANKHNRQPKRIKNWNRKAYLPKGLRTHNTEGLFIKIHHVGGVVQCGE